MSVKLFIASRVHPCSGVQRVSVNDLHESSVTDIDTKTKDDHTLAHGVTSAHNDEKVPRRELQKKTNM